MTADNSTAPVGRKAAMPFIMVTVLIDMMSIGLIIPVLAPLIGTFTKSPSEQAFWYGAVTIVFGIANFFGSPILGRLSDRFGRRPVLLLGFSGLALSFFVTGLSTALWMLLVVRLFSGAMQSNIAVANAYVADITPPEQRAKNFGKLGAMLGVGFILGPVIGGLLGGISLHLPFFAAGGLACVNWLYGYFVLPESLPLERRQPFVLREANPISSLRGLAELKGVGSLVAVVGLSGLAQSMTYTSWVLYTTFKFGWGPTQNGYSLLGMGMMTVLVQGIFLSRLLKRFSPQRLATMGLISSSICFVLWGAATEGWMLYAVFVLNVLGFTVAASIQSLIANAADPKTQGRTMGAVGSLNSMMAVIAPAIGAPLLATVSHLPHGDWRIGAPFYFCALLQAVSTVIALKHFNRARRKRVALASVAVVTASEAVTAASAG
jgi:DHA1 family tetracycline resistance protein-like MFS transporter